MKRVKTTSWRVRSSRRAAVASLVTVSLLFLLGPAGYPGGGSPYDNEAPWGTPQSDAASNGQDQENQKAAAAATPQAFVVEAARTATVASGPLVETHARLVLAPATLVQDKPPAVASQPVGPNAAGRLVVPEGAFLRVEQQGHEVSLQGEVGIEGASHVELRAPGAKGEYQLLVVVTRRPLSGVVALAAAPLQPGQSVDVAKLRRQVERRLEEVAAGGPVPQAFAHVVVLRRSFDVRKGGFAHAVEAWLRFGLDDQSRIHVKTTP